LLFHREISFFFFFFFFFFFRVLQRLHPVMNILSILHPLQPIPEVEEGEYSTPYLPRKPSEDNFVLDDEKKTQRRMTIEETEEIIEGDELLALLNSEFVPVDHMKMKHEIFIGLPTPVKKKSSLNPLPSPTSSPTITPNTSPQIKKLNLRGQAPLAQQQAHGEQATPLRPSSSTGNLHIGSLIIFTKKKIRYAAAGDGDAAW
jgi:hypothetical protein